MTVGGRFKGFIKILTTSSFATRAHFQYSGSMINRTTITLAIVCGALLLLPGTSAAKSPPKGKYECTIGYTLFGDLYIKSDGAYKHRGTKGTFKAGSKKITWKDGRKGWKISFKKGSLNGIKGRWYKTSDNMYEIALRNPEDDFESIYCDKRA